MDRVKKSDPERIRPCRHWQHIFRDTGNNEKMDSAQDKGDTASNGKTRDESGGNNGTSARDNGGGAFDPCSVAEQAVKLGYQVVEEQLNRGRAAAGAFTDFYQGRGFNASANGDGQSGAGYSGFNPAGEFNTLFSQMAKTSMEMSQLYLQMGNSLFGNNEFMNSFSRLWQEGAAAVAPGGTATGTSSQDQNDREYTLTTQVNSKQPAQLKVQLFSTRTEGRLAIHGLHSPAAPDAPLLDIHCLLYTSPSPRDS